MYSVKLYLSLYILFLIKKKDPNHKEDLNHFYLTFLMPEI